jgi:hypothetical protein
MEMTVAQLIAHLAGLPPMMEVYADADGVAMFVNETEVQLREQGPPFLRLKCSVYPLPTKPPTTETVEQQTAKQYQRALDLSAESERKSKMPESVDLHLDYGK